VRKAQALQRAKALAPSIAALRTKGIASANGLASALNQQGIRTARGKQWTARSVLNVMGLMA